MKLPDEVKKRMKVLYNSEKKVINPKLRIFQKIMGIDDDFYHNNFEGHHPLTMKGQISLKKTRYVKFFIFHRLANEEIIINELPNIFGIIWEDSSDYGQYYRYLVWPRMLSYLTRFFPILIKIIEGSDEEKKQYLAFIEQILDDICHVITHTYSTAVSWVSTDQGGFPEDFLHHPETKPHKFPELFKKVFWLNKVYYQNQDLYLTIKSGLVKLREALFTRDRSIRFLLSIAAIENSCLLFYNSFLDDPGSSKQIRNKNKLDKFEKKFRVFWSQKDSMKPSKAVSKLTEIYFSEKISIKKAIIEVLDEINAVNTKNWLFKDKINAYNIRSDLIHGRWIEWDEECEKWFFQQSLSAPDRAQVFLFTLIQYSDKNILQTTN